MRKIIVMERVAKKTTEWSVRKGRMFALMGIALLTSLPLQGFYSTDPLTFAASLSRKKRIKVRTFLNGKLTNSDY